MVLGKPAINLLRGPNFDLRALNVVIGNIALRLSAIEAELQITPTTSVQTAFVNLLNQTDGLVAKVNGVLVTVSTDDDLSLVQQPGTAAGYQLSLNFDTTDNGLVVRLDTGLTTRALLTASGAAVTIEHPDGVAGDPTFHS